MNIKKNILIYIGKTLEEEGFVFCKEGVAWIFDREKNGITQTIIFHQPRWVGGGMKALFYTNAYGQRAMREFRDFVPGIDASINFWEYSTEKQLIDILQQFQNWIVEYGLDFLDKISVPKESEWYKMKNEIYLYENHEKIYKDYCQKWKLEGMESLEIINLLKSKIEELSGKEFSEVGETIIEFAAVYGHAFFKNDEVKWEWDVETKHCKIRCINGMDESLEPLNIIINSYRNQSDYLIEKFSEMLNVRDSYLRPKRIREQKKIFREILGKELKKEGFTYISKETEWSCERIKDDVQQIISIVRRRECIEKEIKIVLKTSVYGQKAKELGDFVPEDIPEFWHFETEEELRQIIGQFKEWVFTYGLDELEKMSQLTSEACPKPEGDGVGKERLGVQTGSWKELAELVKEIERKNIRPNK